VVTLDAGAGPIEVRGEPARGRHRVTPGHSPAIEVGLLAIGDGELTYSMDGVRRTAAFARDGDGVWVEAGGAIRRFQPWDQPTRGAADADDGLCHAPMAAQVVAVAVAVGDRVARGDALVTLRAMKLEHRVAAPWAAIVREVRVREGEQVAFRAVMVRLEAVAKASGAAAKEAR
jgi:geranyl-CoA carboxylase alpha subunit